MNAAADVDDRSKSGGSLVTSSGFGGAAGHWSGESASVDGSAVGESAIRHGRMDNDFGKRIDD